MAFSLAFTRCAVSIFFIRTLYTKGFPWLRILGTHDCFVHDCNYYLFSRGALINCHSSVLLYRLRCYSGTNHYHWRHAALRTTALQLGSTVREPTALLRSQTVCHGRRSSGSRYRRPHLGPPALCGVAEVEASPRAQACDHHYLRLWFSVRYFARLRSSTTADVISAISLSASYASPRSQKSPTMVT